MAKPFIEQEIVYLKNRCKSLEKAVRWLAYDIANHQIVKGEGYQKGEERRKEYMKHLKKTTELTKEEIEQNS